MGAESLVAGVQHHGQSSFSQSNSNFCSSWVFLTNSNMGNKKNKQRIREGTKRRLGVEVARRLLAKDRQQKCKATNRLLSVCKHLQM